MSQPYTLASGTTPIATDTRRILLVKILKALQAQAGSLAHNDPTETDTVWTLRMKITRAKAGI